MFLKDIKKLRSKSYLFTVKPMREEDDIFLAGAKKMVRDLNKEIRDAAKAKGRKAKVQYRLSYTPGPVQARFRWKYEDQPGNRRRIRLEDAQSVDVYVHRRNLE